MLTVLRRQRAEVAQKISARLGDMSKYRRENGVVEIPDGRGNTILACTSTLSTAYTQAEMDVMDLHAQQQATQAALDNPRTASAYVEAEQQKNKESGDREFDELRSQRLQFLNLLSSSAVIQGASNQHVKVLQSQLDSLNQRIHQKEQLMAQAMLAAVNERLIAATQKRDQLRDTLASQTQTALALKPEMYSDMETDVQRLGRLLDTLDTRRSPN
jgi:hypothetical protein